MRDPEGLLGGARLAPVDGDKAVLRGDTQPIPALGPICLGCRAAGQQACCVAYRPDLGHAPSGNTGALKQCIDLKVFPHRTGDFVNRPVDRSSVLD